MIVFTSLEVSFLTAHLYLIHVCKMKYSEAWKYAARDVKAWSVSNI